MDTALGWFGDVVRALLGFFPHLKLVRGTHAGVKFRHGRDYIEIRCDNGMYLPYFTAKFPWVRWQYSGLHIYWPVTTEIEVVPIVRQTTNLPPQYLVTADGRNVGVSGIVISEVSEVVKLLTKAWDYDQVVRDYGMAEIKRVVSESHAEDIYSSDGNVDKKFTLKLRKRLRPFGVKVIRVTLTDFAPVRLLGLMLPSGLTENMK